MELSQNLSHTNPVGSGDDRWRSFRSGLQVGCASRTGTKKPAFEAGFNLL